MATQNDNAIDQLARTICACVRHEVPDDAITDKLDEIVKTAEAKAADLLREAPGNSGG